MSVNKNQRKQGELQVNTDARNLCVYTLKITSNPKTFPLAQASYVEKLRNTTIEICTLCWKANNIRVDGNIDRYNRRLELQNRAINECNSMCVLIEIAKPLFHLSSKRVCYWVKLVTDLRTLIRNWRNSDKQRLKP